MKSFLTSSVALLAAAVPALALEKRQFPGFPLQALSPYTIGAGIGGKLDFPTGPGAIAEVVSLPATDNHELGSRRVKIRYGPYLVPGSDSGMLGQIMDGEGGMLWNMPDKNTKKPCTECMVTFMQAGLEDLHGNEVNADKGLWLHHMVAINAGQGLADSTCKNMLLSLPHIDVMDSASSSERFFASGNERSAINGTRIADKAGYNIKNGDEFSFVIELMNMNKQDAKVFMTITYEYVPGTPKGWLHAKPIWLDAFQCGLSDVSPKSQTQPYFYDAKSWTSDIEGPLLGLGSHVHDGGVNVVIKRNDEVICDSKSNYGETPAYVSHVMTKGMMSDGAKSDTMKHISSQTVCYNTGMLKKGDKLSARGFYDYAKYPGMARNDGKQSDVMVIAIIYAGVPIGQR